MKCDCIYPSKRKSPTFKHKVGKTRQDRGNERSCSDQVGKTCRNDVVDRAEEPKDRLLEIVNQMNSRARGTEELESLPVLQGETVPATSSRQSQPSATVTTGIALLAPAYGENIESFEQTRMLHTLSNPSPSFAYVDEIPMNTGPEAFNDTLAGMSILER